MLPKITELEFGVEQLPDEIPKMGKSFLYDMDKGDFVIRNGKMVVVEGIEALKMWILKAMKTERYRFRIYKDETLSDGTVYGTTIDDLIGSNLPRAYVEAEIKREVTSSLTSHPLIDEIIEWSFERDGKWMLVNFRVVTAEDAFSVEVMF